jgi:tricorn protease
VPYYRRRAGIISLTMQGYYRFPTIKGDLITFVCEDDLWNVPSEGGIARRLTTSLSEVSRPHASPDGNRIAFTASEEGHPEVYIMPALGGEAKRLTYQGAMAMVTGWMPDGQQIIYASNAGRPVREMWLWTISPDGGEPQQLPYGPANHIAFGPKSSKALGRHTLDPARWKRYRGGTAGRLWVDIEGNNDFRILQPANGNLTAPMWIANRIYFISDHEGIGNLFSCLPTGEDLQRHTHHEEYYCRFPTTDGKRIVYHAGADLYVYDPAEKTEHRVPIELRSTFTQRQRKFVETGKYLQGYELHPAGHSLALTVRGKAFTLGNWEGPVLPHGELEGVRHRHMHWLNDGKRLVLISDANGEERLEIHTENGTDAPVRLEDLDIGHVFQLEVSPNQDQVALSNHRCELLLVDLVKKEMRTLDKSDYNSIAGFAWSPDGRWLAYGYPTNDRTCSIKICKVETSETHQVTPSEFQDIVPAWDPEGNYLYFLSYREYNPVYDQQQFDLGFPRAMRAMLITLRKDVPNPFLPAPRPLEEPDDKKDHHDNGDNGDIASGKGVNGNKKPKKQSVEIDFENIHLRVMTLPFAEGIYGQIAGIPENKVLLTSFPIEGSLNVNWFDDEPEAKGTLQLYDFKAQKSEVLLRQITSFTLSRDCKAMAYRSGYKLRVMRAGSKPEKTDSDKPGRQNGWIDLNRAKISVVPAAEWRQMYREAWRLQREFFWTADMSGIDWQRVHDRYLPLLNRVATRAEFSDLMWEMQGELGTSHCYEMGGDYRQPPRYAQGFLGADVVYDDKKKGYCVIHIVEGDPWDEKADSPLNEPGVNVQVGDILLAINGQTLSLERAPGEVLVNTAGQEVQLTLRCQNGETRTVTLKTLPDETRLRYREWVRKNREYVHQRTGGQVGYLHIPDMGARGYSEFHRGYLAELVYPGLIVDVRNNGGGHVSPLILEKLARKRVGYDVPRWGKPIPYPYESVMGPIVALTDERAGSDGDIFSHCFKLMKLGTLIGKRTWGGVIGISPKSAFVDGGLTTQPEYSFWFVDVGWAVENYGTDPDIEIEYRPQDYMAGVDPQLDRAIDEIVAQMEANPPRMPDFDNRPRLPLPVLLSEHAD